MSGRGAGQLFFIEGMVNATKYQQILAEALLPSLGQLDDGGGVTFQQDGASSHTAKTTKRWLQDHHLDVLEWPSNSPDMSPIENIWALLKAGVRKRKPRTKEALKVILQELWDAIDPAQCAQLVATMNTRLEAVIARQGDVTKF